VRDELKEGDQVLVKVINIDPSGKVRLSRKALLEPDPAAAAAAAAAGEGSGHSHDRGDRGPRHGPGGGRPQHARRG
jgi:polyribonucleotide nucleotidyltransferase